MEVCFIGYIISGKIHPTLVLQNCTFLLRAAKKRFLSALLNNSLEWWEWWEFTNRIVLVAVSLLIDQYI